MKRFAAVLAAGMLVAALVMLLFFTIPFEQINFYAYDFTMRMAGALPPAAPITIVTIDEDSLLREGQWQWKRFKLGQLLAGVQREQPLAIGMDIMLDDAESTDGDEALAAAIEGGSPVVLPVRVRPDGSDKWARPQPRFMKAGARIGHVHTDPDSDGINRRVKSVKAAEGGVLPAFSLEVLRAAGATVDPGFVVQEQDGVAIVRNDSAAIRFAGPTGKTFPQVSAWKLIQGSTDISLLRGRIVLIGLTAEGLQEDRWFTPFSFSSGLKMPGVEIHANAIDTLYAGRWIRDVPLDAMFGALFVLVVLLAWIDRRFEGARFYVAALLLIPGVVVVSWLLMKNWNIWLPFPPFIATLALVVPGLEVLKVIGVNRDLDSKIERLSRWEEVSGAPSRWSWNPAELVRQSVPAGPSRENWLEAIEAYDQTASKRRAEKRQLLEPRRNAKWRLGAVDFFNEELVRFLEFNRAILSSIEDVTIVSDVGGRIVYQNPAAHLLVGFRENPPFGPQYFAELLDGRDFLTVFSEVLGSRKTITMNFVQAFGGRRFFNVVLAPIGDMGLVMSLHDATSQHELNLAKNEMVSLVSHELRTPLTAIQGYSDMLLKYDLVPDKGRKFLETILEESGRLGKLIQSFLDIAYIESGRKQVVKTEFEVGPMLRDLQSVLDPMASGKKINVAISDVGINSVRGDRTLLYQALINLLTNAVKYSPDGSAIRLAVSVEDGHALFEVADQGHGIAPEDTGRVFDKFFRCANKETLQQSGFGLGLAFVKEVALQHGGEIRVQSQVGKGSTFTMRIPL